jgi:hypothetical protein
MESRPTSESAPSSDGGAPASTWARARQRLAAWQQGLSAPVSAFVVDLFRVCVGLMVVVYYFRLFLEFGDYTSETGFLDHALHRHFFWYTELTLLYPGCPDAYKLALLAAGMLGAVMLAVGWHPKVGAAISWVIAVSVQRWNFAVINVDDSSITLLLWWILFLPVGHCLTYRTRDWRSEVRLQVDGFFVRAFFANLFIYYLTAGLTKLWSPLWREGLALFVILKLPLARTNAWWNLGHLPALWLGNHFTLIFEPLVPFLLLLPKGHPLKYFLGLAQIGLHVAIPLTIGVPYANFALILGMILEFHGELNDLFRRKAGETGPTQLLPWTPAKGTRGLARLYLIVLALAMMKGVPGIGGVYEPAMATLYWGGIAQEYHLFDWIDRYNWYVKNKVEVTPDGKAAFEADPADLFPATVRGFIVQSYLLPMRWMRIPRPMTGEMRNSVLRRAAERFVRNQRATLGQTGTVRVLTDLGRVTRDNLDLSDTWPVETMTFRYDAKGAVSFFQPIMPNPVAGP